MLKSEGDEVGKKFDWPVCKGQLVVHGCGQQGLEIVTWCAFMGDFGVLGNWKREGGWDSGLDLGVWFWLLLVGVALAHLYD